MNPATPAPADPLLEIEGLCVDVGRRRRHRILHEVSFGVGTEETVAVVGESGAGKSTIGRAILGLVPISAGTLRLDGRDITHLDPRTRAGLASRLQVVFQDPNSSLNPSRSVRSSLAEPLLATPLGPAAVSKRVGEMLERVGLPASAADRYPRQFSGGQRQRIAIARALMLAPRLVVCDEALSALDLSVQAQIINLLREVKADLGLSYVFIGHDLAVVRQLADRVVVLRAGRVVESGPTEQVCGGPTDPYTRELMAAAPVPDPLVERARVLARAEALLAR